MILTPEQINRFKELHEDCDGYSDIQIEKMLKAEIEEDKFVEDLARALVFISRSIT